KSFGARVRRGGWTAVWRASSWTATATSRSCTGWGGRSRGRTNKRNEHQSHRDHREKQSQTACVFSVPVWFDVFLLFPLDRRRWLAGDVVDHAVDALDLVD